MDIENTLDKLLRHLEVQRTEIESLENEVSKLAQENGYMKERMYYMSDKIEQLEKILHDPRNIVKHRMRDEVV